MPRRQRRARLPRLRALRPLVAATALLATLGAMPAAAAADPVAYTEEVRVAAGVWINETETTFSDLTLQVYYISTSLSGYGKNHTKIPQVKLYYVHKETDPATNTVLRTEYEGFVGDDASAKFTFDTTLSGAKATIDVPLSGYQCIDSGPAGMVPEEPCVDLEPVTVTLDLAWTGVGEVFTFTDGVSIKDIPGFKFHSKLRGSQRNAVLTGSVAGGGLDLAQGDPDMAFLLTGSYREETVAP